MPTTRRPPKPRPAARTAAAAAPKPTAAPKPADPAAAAPKPRMRRTKAERELQRLFERVRPLIESDTVDPIDFLIGRPDVVADLHALIDALEAKFGDCEMTLETRPAKVLQGRRMANVCTVHVVDPPDPSAVLNVWGDWVDAYYGPRLDRRPKHKGGDVRIMAYATRKEWVAA